MAFNRKNWQDNVSDITAAELNRIEQGIYNNSLVVDAVTKKLNPTDTETYKTTELTEGQITDVIGVKDILIKGQTSQNGTPTPSAPVDVNVVSGSNVIDIENENLVNEDNLEVFNNNRYVKFNDNYYINAEPNTAYTLSIEVFAGDGKFVEYDENNNILKETSIYSILTNGYVTITTTANTKKIKFYAQMYSSVPSETPTKYTAKCMLKKGSTATPYEPHQGKELPLDLDPIELCKIGNYQDYFYRDNNKGKWYLHKETVKIIIPSLENGVMQNNQKRFFINNIHLGNYDVLRIPSATQTYGLYCSILKEVTGVNTWGGIQGISYDHNASVVDPVGFDFVINGLTTVEEYREALEGKIIVARLNTPTNTEITDTTLISQLEAIYNAPLYEQTNITQENNDLPMVLDITACKDNINGIKAFIRK